MPRVTITAPEKSPQPYRFQLDRRVVTLGRGSNNDIVIDCGSVSVSHAEMLRVDGGYELRDLGSTNGIKLDGVRSEAIPLRSGISVKLGDVAFDFVLSDEEREALAREKPEVESPIFRDLGEPPPRPVEAESREDLVVVEEEPSENGGRIGCGTVVLFLVLVALAFCVGLAIRHQKETGKSWIEAVQQRFQPAPENAAPATPPPAPPGDLAE
ncbi:MAG: FHA domain-containing protein [Luteolibacter sp.]|jgi:pSer/pThr/pTyr-binding forkhead associated (FHA) protein|nr:FHA domain-containing protein [Luteolibacter sp.]